ncbi:MAG: cupin domain-containing protein [Nevskia sp.]|nr:cupin domain-containing protein [Nevskia sp.]
MIDFGTTSQRFYADLFEKSVHLRKGAFLQRPYTWPDLDLLLEQMEPAEPFFRLFGKGPLPPDTYSEEVQELGLRRRRLIRSRFDALLAEGATLVLNRLEVFSPPSRRLCAEVGRFTGQQTTANGYVSFGGEGTFGQHWDVHDVFACQLIGRKRWRVYPPTLPYPLANHTSDRSPDPCPQSPVLDCTLEPGDLLYIPRGWWHHATPLDVASFHVSVATFAPTIMDYVLWACGRYLPAQQLARKSLGGGADCLNEVAAVTQMVAAALLDPNHVAEFMKLVMSRQHPPEESGPGLLSGLVLKPPVKKP